MALAVCVLATRHYKVGDQLDIAEDHPFIKSGSFVLVKPPVVHEPEKPKKILKKPKPK